MQTVTVNGELMRMIEERRACRRQGIRRRTRQKPQSKTRSADHYSRDNLLTSRRVAFFARFIKSFGRWFFGALMLVGGFRHRITG